MSDSKASVRSGIHLHGGELPPADTLPEPTIVDVLFLYTPQALAAEGGDEGLRRRVLESVDSTNLRLANSLIHVRIHPVFIGQISYNESGDIPTDANRYVNASDGLDRVAQLRNDYKADLVCLIVESDKNGIWGWAGDITPPQGNPITGWTIVRRLTLYRDGSNLPHELGHLLGCDHDREHPWGDDPAFYAARKPYMFGHRFQVEGVIYTDVMSYEPGILTPYFSNPRLDLDGVPRGVPAGVEGAADGARTINETAPYVALYRNARSRIEFAETDLSVREQEGSAVVRLVRTGDLVTSTGVTVLFSSASTAKSGSDYTLPASRLVSFATNQAVAELVIPILADDTTEPEEILRLNLGSVLGEHGLGTNSTVTVTLRDATARDSDFLAVFDVSPVVVHETAGKVDVRFSASAGAIVDGSTVPYHTENGTATAGVDFQEVTGTWSVSREPFSVSIPILNRPEPGVDRSFKLIVGSRTNQIRILDAQRQGSLAAVSGAGLGVEFDAAARQDGSLLVWGNFDRIGGVARDSLALIKPDGSVDEAFQPPTLLLGHRRLDNIGEGFANASINRIGFAADGRILVAGMFSRVNGMPRGSMIRLYQDGRLDESFGQNLKSDGGILDFAIQPDGKILVGGDFERIHGARRPFITRLNADGTLDDSFASNGGPVHFASTVVFAVALQTDGRILIGGRFDTVDGQPSPYVARLNPDGTWDPTFKLRNGAAGQVESILITPDGKIVLVGLFDAVGGRIANRIARLNSDGSVDTTFRPPNPNGGISQVVCLPDGRMLVSGRFTRIAGQSRSFLARLKQDGTFDDSFDPGLLANPSLATHRLNVLGDGTVLLSGMFETSSGKQEPRLVKLAFGSVAPLLEVLALDGPGFRAKVRGVVGGRYVIHGSRNLQDWSPLGEVLPAGFEPDAIFTVSAEQGTGFLRLSTESR